MDVEKYRELYLTEAQKQVAAMERALVSLRGSPGDVESLEGMCRAAHTLKGMSATMGYEQLARLSGDLEKLTERVRHGSATGKSEFAGLLSDCVAALRVLIEGVAAGGGHDLELTPLLGRITPFL